MLCSSKIKDYNKYFTHEMTVFQTMAAYIQFIGCLNEVLFIIYNVSKFPDPTLKSYTSTPKLLCYVFNEYGVVEIEEICAQAWKQYGIWSALIDVSPTTYLRMDEGDVAFQKGNSKDSNSHMICTEQIKYQEYVLQGVVAPIAQPTFQYIFMSASFATV